VISHVRSSDIVIIIIVSKEDHRELEIKEGVTYFYSGSNNMAKLDVKKTLFWIFKKKS
jgi:hypothetical protein